MRRFCLFFVLLICSFRLLAEGDDLLVLRSGAELQGRFLSLQGSRVRFQPRWSENPSVLPVGEMEAVFFGGAEGNPTGSATHRALFWDGDRLTGKLLAREEDTLSFRLEGGETVEVLTSQIHSLETRPSGDDLLLEDLMDAGTWQSQGMPGMARQGGAVQVQAGIRIQAMHMNNMPMQINAHLQTRNAFPLESGGSWFFDAGQGFSLYRSVPDLPERFRLAYALRPLGGAFLIHVGAFTPQPFQRGAGGMHFMHQNSHIQGQSFHEQSNPGGERPPMVNWREQTTLPEGHWQEFEVFVDQTRNRAWMRLNGEPMQEWEVAFDPENESGRWLSLQIQHNVAGVQLAGIELTRWDGSFPGRQVERFESAGDKPPVRSRRSREAEIRLRRYPDKLTLRVREITETHVIAEGGGFAGEVRLSRGQVAGLRFPWMSGGSGTVPGLSIDLDTPILQMQPLPRGRGRE